MKALQTSARLYMSKKFTSKL